METLSENSCITLEGRIEKIVYHHPKSGYTVLQLTSAESSQKNTIVGHFKNSLLGKSARFSGAWQQHAQHGKQFFAQTIEILQNQPLSQSEWLVLFIEGIGESYAKKIGAAFGDNLQDILENKPERLREIPGIGKQRLQKIRKGWEAHKSSHAIFVFLTQHNISSAMAYKIYKHYGDETLAIVSENPYTLIADIEGFSFEEADNIGMALDFAKQDPRRLAAGIQFIITQHTQFGHCGIERSLLLQKGYTLLQVQEQEINECLTTLIENKTLIETQVNNIDCIFDKVLWDKEHYIANKLLRILKEKKSKKCKTLYTYLEHEIAAEKLTLSDEQQDAIRLALESNVFVLTGGPGVGKTTLVRLLVKIYGKSDWNIALCAPTGRAAKRLTQVTHFTAKTIHRLLEFDPHLEDFSYNRFNRLKCDLIIIDEMSMVDTHLTYAVLQALSKKTRILFIGDSDQLSSIGPGDVLRSILRSQVIPSVTLQKIYRQDNTSQIIINAHRVNQGQMLQCENTPQQDCYWIRSPTEQMQTDKLITLITQRLPERFAELDLFDDVQVLTPTNEGIIGVKALNQALQNALNPCINFNEDLKLHHGVFRLKDKVIQIVNNYDKNIFNGDIGRIIKIEKSLKTVTVRFDQAIIAYKEKEIDQLRLAYAMTVHKSQGCEYPVVIILLSSNQRPLLKRNLLYTAITRAQSCVILLSNEAALQHAIKTNDVSFRISNLTSFLQAKSEKNESIQS